MIELHKIYPVLLFIFSEQPINPSPFIWKTLNPFFVPMEFEEAEEVVLEVDEEKLNEIVAEGSLDFDSWTSLISQIEKVYPDDIEKISSVYDCFLSSFPLCHGYWRKYAVHKTRFCSIDDVIGVFERAVQSATYSVGLWVDYCAFSMSVFKEPCDVRRLFKRALSFVGKDYLCHTLWDQYIQFELCQQQWSSLAYICIQTLQFPTKKLHQYYDGFKKLVSILEKEMGILSNFTMEGQSEFMLDNEFTTFCKNEDILGIVKALLDPCDVTDRSKQLQNYLFVGEKLFREACQLSEKIERFEALIQRSFFHVKPLDEDQLENWHHYLDFVETLGDFDWAVKLYERCLIPCAFYPEFWMRYVQFVETKGGREIANFALDRATQVFLKCEPPIHLLNSRFKEQIREFDAARAAFHKCDREFDLNSIENVVREANMEKRMGNFEAASRVYKAALEMAIKKKNLDGLPMLYVHYSRHTYVVTRDLDAAVVILRDGINHMPCKLLLEELIKFLMMHGGSKNIDMADSIVVSTLYPEYQGISSEDKEGISSLYLEFVDLCGTIHDLMKAWNRHIRLFPHSVRTISYNQSFTGRKLLNFIVQHRPDTLPDMLLQASAHSSPDELSHISMQVETQKVISPETQPALITNQHLELEANPCEKEEQLKLAPTFSKESAEEHEPTGLEIQQDLGPISLETLTLKSDGIESPLAVSTSSLDPAKNIPEESTVIHGADEKPKVSDSVGACFVDSPQDSVEDIVENRLHTNGSSTSSSKGSPADLDKVMSEYVKVPASLSSPVDSPTSSSGRVCSTQLRLPSAGRENFIPKLAPLPPRKDVRHQFRGESRHRRHQQRQYSSREHQVQRNMGTQMNPSQNPQLQTPNQPPLDPSQYSIHSAYPWPSQYSQQENSASASGHPPPQMSQYIVQTSEQTRQTQQEQGYNQMCQYYYYQQYLQQQQQPHQFQQQWQQYWQQIQYQQQLQQYQMALPLHQQQPQPQQPPLDHEQLQQLVQLQQQRLQQQQQEQEDKQHNEGTA